MIEELLGDFKITRVQYARLVGHIGTHKASGAAFAMETLLEQLNAVVTPTSSSQGVSSHD